MNSIVEENLVSFKELEKNIFDSKIKILNFTPLSYDGIYLCKSGVYSFI